MWAHWVRFWAVSTVVVALATQSPAASFTRDDTISAGTILVEGEIEAGDAAKLMALIRTGGRPFGYTMWLNSGGGSFAEGLKISKLVREYGVGTVVGPGASCKSACAIIFMHGTEKGGDDFVGLSRKLSRKGRLGFHAPHLPLPDDLVPSRQMVADAYAVALASIAELMEVSAGWFHPDLLKRFLRVPPDQMMIVETYGDLWTWHIELLEPEPSPRKLTKSELVRACMNLDAVINNLRPEVDEDYVRGALVEGGALSQIGRNPQTGDQMWFLSINEMDSVGCRLGISKRDDGTLDVSYYGSDYSTEPSVAKDRAVEGAFFHLPSESFLQ